MYVDLYSWYVCVSVGHQVDQQQEDEEEGEQDEVSVQLQMEDVTLTTLDLKEHEIKPNKKKLRKRKERKPEATEKEGNMMEREGIIVVIVETKTIVSLKTFLVEVNFVILLYISFYLCMHG